MFEVTHGMPYGGPPDVGLQHWWFAVSFHFKFLMVTLGIVGNSKWWLVNQAAQHKCPRENIGRACQGTGVLAAVQGYQGADLRPMEPPG